MQPVRQYRIDSETSTQKALEGASARVDGWISAGDLRIGRVVGPEGVRVRASAGNAGSSERLAATVLVMEGRTAEIWTGSDVPVTTRTVERAGRYGRVTESTQLVPVRSGFRVRPRGVGDSLIEVEITPIVEELGPRRLDPRDRRSHTDPCQTRASRWRSGASCATRPARGVDAFQGAARGSAASESLFLIRVTPLDDAVPASRGR